MKKFLIFVLVLGFFGLLLTNPTNEKAKTYFRSNTPYNQVFKGVSLLSANVMSLSMCRDNYFIFSRYYLKVEALYVAEIQVYYATGIFGKMHVRKDFQDGSYLENLFNGDYEKDNLTHDECSPIYGN
ncbi:MAG: hypothetical protein LBV72_04880 [Tannerella sp.]|jgi:hypothetical protein|nr:hypothetical protein [Tannerella sp.]